MSQGADEENAHDEMCADVSFTGACAVNLILSTEEDSGLVNGGVELSEDETMHGTEDFGEFEGRSAAVEPGVGSSEEVTIRDATNVGSATQSVHMKKSGEQLEEEEQRREDASEEARVIASIVDRVDACEVPLTLPLIKIA